MTRSFSTILILLIIFFGSNSMATSDTPSSIRVTVDPRIELLTIVQLLADFENRSTFITELDYSYKKDVLAHFSQYASHAAPVMYPDMLPFGFSFDAPVQALLHCSKPPELKQLAPMPKDVLQRSGGVESLEAFIASLRDFATTTEFMTFFNAHRTYYDSVTEAVCNVMAGENYIAQLEEYCGAKQGSYTLILAPLQSPAGYGPRVCAPDGTMDVFFVIGAGKIEKGLPIFGDKNSLEYMAWHEFGHSFVNPLVDSNAAEIMKYTSLFKPISARMKEQAYGDWKTCATEHILRAVNARMTYLRSGQEAGEKAIQYNRGNAFAYVVALCTKLDEYEKRRDKYPTLKSFFPELVGVFKQLSEAKLGADFYDIPFLGTINAVVTDKKGVVLIVPSNESDQAVQDRIRGHVQKIRDYFYKESPILLDTVALKTDLSANSVIAYGTATGNLWLAQLMPKLPVRIEQNCIVADTVYPGTNLRFISAWPNPRNSAKGIVVYTAQWATDILGINDVFHGPTDYVVARGTDVLKAGDYEKKNNDWGF